MPNRQQNYKDHGKARQTHHNQKRRYYASRRFGDGKRHQWTTGEIERVLRHEITDTELAREIGTSVASIHKMRAMYKKRGENNG